jgi:hypothetical protein
MACFAALSDTHPEHARAAARITTKKRAATARQPLISKIFHLENQSTSAMNAPIFK